jgi:rare lipoprotein A
MRAALFAVLTAGVMAAGCGTTPRGHVRVEYGEASYYAAKYAGRKTASGERYDPRRRTAAHRTLPFETRVKVTNPANGRSVVVRINDRGPFVKGRVIDLSRRAAEEIGIIDAGTARVRVEVLELGR